jgi:hypothetical protein
MNEREQERLYVDALKVAAVAALPRRTAHALHALVEAERTLNMPVSAQEVVVFDSEALNATSTALALAHARSLGYCFLAKGLWMAANRAHELRPQLEARYLKETDL